MIEQKRCLICQNELSDEGLGTLRNLVGQIQVSSETSNILMSIKNELGRIIMLRSKYPEKREGFITRIRQNEKNIEDVEEELQGIENSLSRFSDKPQIKQWYEERKKHEQLKELNLQKLGAKYSHLEIAEKEKEKQDKALANEISKDAECKRISQLIQFAQKSRSIIRNIEEEMMHEVRRKMQERTTHYFNTLVWKKNTYKNIKLNEQYQLDLFHVDGYSCLGTCSAAERALLALSFTLGLHEVSGFDSLLFIDTPVARVSDKNRKNFAEVIRDVSKNKQIILTFTPDEYSPEISRIFDASAVSKVELGLVNEEIVAELK